MLDLNLDDIRERAKSSVSHHWLMANLANVANLANEKKPDSPEKLATLATLASSHGPESTQSVATLATLATLATVATPPPPKPTPRFSVHAPWNVADTAYQDHHWQCQQCRVNARTRDREPRCAIGQELYTAYELAAMKGHQ